MKRTNLKKISDNRDKDADRIQRMELAEKDRAFYIHIWDNRPCRCFETNELLSRENSHIHHILHKETYPEYRHESWNVIIVSATVHDQIHLDIKKCPKTYTLYLELLDKHINFE